jgi:acid phosphatase type 7
MLATAFLVAAPKTKTAELHTIQRGPYLQNLTSGGVTITWADETLSKGVVQYGESKDKFDRSLTATVVNPKDVKPWNGYQQEVTISGLKPGVVYYYRVTSTPAGQGVEPAIAPGSFATPRLDEKSVSFAVIADTHNYKRAADLADRLEAEQPHLILLAGDYNKAKAGLFAPYRKVLRRIPIYFARGNHDNVAKHKQFVAMPGPGKDLYYSFRRGGVLFLSVDTNDRKGLQPGGDQHKWLENELKNSKETWKFVFQHHPIYSAWGGKMDIRLDEERKLLEKYNVDVVFQGHMHNYDRSFPLRDQKPVAPGKGVVYITASGACGGYEKFPHPHRLWFIARQWRGAPFLGMCTVNGKHATIQFTTASGLLFDSLKLQAK